MKKEELINRTKQFAIRVFILVEKFPKTFAADTVAKQLLRSSSSVAANYRAVNRAKSKNDFSNKLKIVLEEADESNFWLEFSVDVSLLKPSAELDFLIKESDEFVAMLTAALKTLDGK